MFKKILWIFLLSLLFLKIDVVLAEDACVHDPPCTDKEYCVFSSEKIPVCLSKEENGKNCARNESCLSGHCLSTQTSSVCGPESQASQTCGEKFCMKGLSYCFDSVCIKAIGLDGVCSKSLECSSGNCVGGKCVESKCSTPCKDTEKCAEATSGGWYCISKTEEGGICTENKDCLSNICETSLHKCVPDCSKRLVATDACEKSENIENCRKKCETEYCSLSTTVNGSCVLKTATDADNKGGTTVATYDNAYWVDKYPVPDGYKGALPDCAFSGTCRDVNDLLLLIIKFAGGMFGILGTFAFAFFVYGGFTMILSFGNAEKVKKGQQILVAAVIGVVIAFIAYMAIQFLLDAVGVSTYFRSGI